jgi:hypothetical protein
MKKKPPVPKKAETFSCCICKAAIEPSAEPCCTLLIERGVPGWKQRPTYHQEVWAHGECLKRVIPAAEYSFPELEVGRRKIN